MRRRDFVAFIGGTLALPPFATRAQPLGGIPVVGYLSVRTLKSEASLIAAFLKGLGGGGFVEGQSIAIEYRFADGHYEQLPALAADNDGVPQESRQQRQPRQLAGLPARRAGGRK
jgi:putative ABC transport system substrate-binding protein